MMLIKIKSQTYIGM